MASASNGSAITGILMMVGAAYGSLLALLQALSSSIRLSCLSLDSSRWSKV
jgi:hypothetical protein